jgi:hypothetical protein
MKLVTSNGFTYKLQTDISKETSMIVNTKGFGDPEMMEYLNLSTQPGYDGGGISNFNHVDFYHYNPVKKSGEWGAVANFQTLSKSDVDYLLSIQPKDGKDDQRRNWLFGNATEDNPARPYWVKTDGNGGTSYYFGTMVFGHSKIRVESENGRPKVYTLRCWFPNKPTYSVGEFVKVVGFKREHMSKSVEWLLENAYIQRCTAAYTKPVHDTITDTPSGMVIYHPVWDFSEWGHSNLTHEHYIWRNAIYY